MLSVLGCRCVAWSLGPKVEDGIDGAELDGEVLQEGEDGRSVKVP